MTRGRGAAALAAVLAGALALRLWGIGYGLPWLFYFHDEPQVVLRALRFGTGDFNPHFFIWPGTLLLWLAFASYGGLFVVGRVAGWWAGKEGFAAAYFQDPSVFYLLPRLHSVGFGVATVGLAFGLGRAAYSPAVGLAAAIGLAVNAVHAHYSHLVHPVTAMTAFTVLGLWAAVRLATGGTSRHLLVGAAAAGLGASAQYHAGLLAVPLGVALAYRLAEAPAAERVRWLAHGLTAAGLAALVFVTVSPFVVLDYATFRADLAWIAAKTSGELQGGAAPRMADGFMSFVRRCLVPGLGMPLSVVALAGTVLAVARHRRADVLLLVYAAAYFLLASRAAVFNDRYAIPLVVPALLFSARFVEWTLERLRAGFGTTWRVSLATGLLCAPSALELVRTDLTMTRGDTRVESLRWFERNVPAEEPVLIDMLQFWNTASTPLSENRARLLERVAEVEAGVSGAGHSDAYLPYYRFKLAHLAAPAYYLRSTQMGGLPGLVDTLRSGRFRWAVTSSDAYEPHRQAAAGGDSTAYRYYLELERRGERVAEFTPQPWRRLGPTIRVYRLGSR